jgi:putative transcriptional regulator
MESNSWIITSTVTKIKLLENPQHIFWKQILELGGEYLIWSNAPENPYLN